MKQIAQKFVGVGVLMLFMLSVVPFAFAESSNTNSGHNSENQVEDVEGTDTEGPEVENQDVEGQEVEDQNVENEDVDVQEVNETTVAVTNSPKGDRASRVQAHQDVKANREATREEMKVVRESMKQDMKAAHEEIKGARMDLRESRRMFHEERMVARDEMKRNRDEVMKIKDQFKKCEGSACDELKMKFNAGVKNQVQMLLTQIDSSIEQLNERVNASGAMSNEDKTQALSDIATLEEKVAAKRAQVEAFPENATKEDLKMAVQDFKTFVIEVRHEQRKLVALLISSKVDSMVSHQGVLAEVMQAKIDELNSIGADTSALVELRAKFVNQTSEIMADQDSAQAAWVDAETKDDKHAAWVEAHGKVKEGFDASRETLREFMKVYKELKSQMHEQREASKESEHSSVSGAVDVNDTEVEQSNATEVEDVDENQSVPEVEENESVNVTDDNTSVNATAEASE